MDGSRADQRRRRVLLEETCRHDEAAIDRPRQEASREPLRPNRLRYGPLARREKQMPITALLPLRRWTILVVGLSGATAVVCLAAAYGQVWLHQDRVPIPIRRLVDVGRTDSLASCLLAFFWLVIAATSLLVFQIRRHRSDDYRGTYRLWLWVTIASVIVAIDHLTRWREIGSAAAVALLGWPPGYARLYWQIPAASIGVGLLVRLLIEVRECPRHWLGYAGWVAGILVATAAGTLSGSPGADMLPDMVAFVSTGLGTLALWTSVLAYGRHVALEAEGIAPVRKTTRREPTQPRHKQRQPSEETSEPNRGPTLTKTEPDLSSSTGPAAIRCDAPSQASGGQAATHKVSPPVPQPSDRPNPGLDHLTRSERKRLKKLQAKQRAAA